MSIASGNEIETAAGQDNIGSSATTDNAIVFEASEDRRLHAVLVTVSKQNCVAEVSFSNTPLLDGENVDDIASGVVAVQRPGDTNNAQPGNTGTYIRFPESAAPHWEAGEELNVHINNFETSETQVRVIAYYVPVGDFSRERLRNR